MTKTEFLQYINNNYFDNCVIKTTEVIIDNSVEKPLLGTYIFLTLQDTIDFFNNNFNEDMFRTQHNTKILTVEIVQNSEE
jgi:hypothetical protein